MNFLMIVMMIPLIFGIACLFFRKAAPWIALAASFAEALMAFHLTGCGDYCMLALNLRTYIFSAGIFFAASIFALLVVLYSIKFMEHTERNNEYYAYVMFTVGSAAGVFFANDFVTLLVYWGMLGALLYLLIGLSGVGASAAAKKTLMIVGGADALMILGIGIVWVMTGSFKIGSYPIALDSMLSVSAFLCLAAAAFAKAGAMPLHGWIPDSAEVAYTPVMALLPASLDKLLGIYLLGRLTLDVFQVAPNSNVSIFLLAAGSFTIVAGVMAALVQHDMKKLLSYHAVSQVGYMILGIGTALPIGIAGGLFHMLNNAVYKSCLFLTAGNVEKKTGTTDLDKLGGLAGAMPLTFISAAVAALSISGIPPFNGFVSKWMIYQSLMELSKTGWTWMIWLCAAMFGSALTLASFIKLVHAVFLGQVTKEKAVSEVPWMMWLPPLLLAATCLVFGIFAFQFPLGMFILRSIPGVEFAGAWRPLAATALLLAGLLIGLLIYLAGLIRKPTTKPSYIGGEAIKESMVKVPATGFYNAIKDWGPLGTLYAASEKNLFDVYNWLTRGAFALNSLMSWLHNGLLDTYFSWMFIGFVILIIIFVY